MGQHEEEEVVVVEKPQPIKPPKPERAPQQVPGVMPRASSEQGLKGHMTEEGKRVPAGYGISAGSRPISPNSKSYSVRTLPTSSPSLTPSESQSTVYNEGPEAIRELMVCFLFCFFLNFF